METTGGGEAVVETSAEETSPVETKAPEAEPKPPPKPRTIDDDLEDVFKKHGGTTYKAGGKEKKAASWADAKRVLASRDASESVVSEALKVKQAAEARQRRMEALERDGTDVADYRAELKAAGFSDKAINKLVSKHEDHVLSSVEKEKQQATLTPRERELQSELETLRTEKAQRDEERAQWEREQQENEQVQKSSALYEKVTGIAARALQKAKIAGTHAPRFLPAIAAEIDRAETLGLDYGEDEIAETVMREHEELADGFYGGLEIPALAERLGSIKMVCPDWAAAFRPALAGKEITRLEVLMLHEAKRIRDRQNGGQVAQPVARPVVNGHRPQSVAEKMDAARTFGGFER